MFVDIVGEARTADESDVESRRLSAAADEAADRSGAKDGDLGQPRPR